MTNSHDDRHTDEEACSILLQARLRAGQDEDLIAWYRSLEPGRRSQAVRQALRRGVPTLREGDKLDAVLAILRRWEQQGLKVTVGQGDGQPEPPSDKTAEVRRKMLSMWGH